MDVEDYYRTSEFLTRAIEAAFDWVFYESNQYVRLSVIPDSKWIAIPVATIIAIGHYI